MLADAEVNLKRWDSGVSSLVLRVFAPCVTTYLAISADKNETAATPEEVAAESLFVELISFPPYP